MITVGDSVILPIFVIVLYTFSSFAYKIQPIKHIQLIDLFISQHIYFFQKYIFLNSEHRISSLYFTEKIMMFP